MRIVIDIDDTISTTYNRDYANAIPHDDVIAKINELYDAGHEIILYTARGQKSCNGDLEKIKEKNKETLVTWLEKNRVKYDTLLFGKPLGDLYVDDKAMEVREFVKAEFKTLSGGSNKEISRFGRYVKKDLGSIEAKELFMQWIDKKPSWVNTPHIISYLYNEVYMDYIEGEHFGTEHSITCLFDKLIDMVMKFGTYKYATFNIDYHLNKLEKHRLDEFIGDHIDKCKVLLKQIEPVLTSNASFSHGDLIFSNMIVNGDEIYFIDPLANQEASSYLFDFAKIRMSLDNYECIFGISDNYQFPDTKRKFDEMMREHNLLEPIKILEYMHIIRLYRYKSPEDRLKVLRMLKVMEEEL